MILFFILNFAGIDYLSIARKDEVVKVHQILLRNKVIKLII